MEKKQVQEEVAHDHNNTIRNNAKGLFFGLKNYL